MGSLLAEIVQISKLKKIDSISYSTTNEIFLISQLFLLDTSGDFAYLFCFSVNLTCVSHWECQNRYQQSLKVIVHPTIKTLSSFTSSCSKPVWISFSWWTQKMIFWRMLVTKQMMLATVWKKNTMEVNSYRQLFGYQHSSKYFILCSAEERNSYGFGTTSGWVSFLGELYLNYPSNFALLWHDTLKSAFKSRRSQ